MKRYNLYENDLDRSWYDSSNVVYSECDDKEGELKVVRITFKDGRTYKYTKVDVRDYLMFREASSQGKALNQFIKQYEVERIDNLDVNKLNEELEELLNPAEDSFEVKYTSTSFTVMNNGKEIERIEKGEKGYSLDDLVKIITALKIKCEKE